MKRDILHRAEPFTIKTYSGLERGKKGKEGKEREGIRKRKKERKERKGRMSEGGRRGCSELDLRVAAVKSTKST